MCSFTKPQDSYEGLVNTPLLLGGDPADQIAEPSRVDRAHLLHQDSGCIAEQLDLRAERRGLGAERSWRDQDYRARQQFVGLNDHSVSAATLLMTCSARRPEFVDVTPEHAGSP